MVGYGPRGMRAYEWPIRVHACEQGGWQMDTIAGLAFHRLIVQFPVMAMSMTAMLAVLMRLAQITSVVATVWDVRTGHSGANAVWSEDGGTDGGSEDADGALGPVRPRPRWEPLLRSAPARGSDPNDGAGR